MARIRQVLSTSLFCERRSELYGESSYNEWSRIYIGIISKYEPALRT